MDEAREYVDWGGPANPKVFQGAAYDDESAPETVFT